MQRVVSASSQPDRVNGLVDAVLFGGLGPFGFASRISTMSGFGSAQSMPEDLELARCRIPHPVSPRSDRYHPLRELGGDG